MWQAGGVGSFILALKVDFPSGKGVALASIFCSIFTRDCAADAFVACSIKHRWSTKLNQTKLTSAKRSNRVLCPRTTTVLPLFLTYSSQATQLAYRPPRIHVKQTYLQLRPASKFSVSDLPTQRAIILRMVQTSKLLNTRYRPQHLGRRD